MAPQEDLAVATDDLAKAANSEPEVNPFHTDRVVEWETVGPETAGSQDA